MPTIAQLDDATLLVGTEYVPVLQDGQLRKAHVSDLGGGAGGGVIPSSDNFTFTQGVPSSSWSVTHNLGRFPSVAVVDSSGRLVEGDVNYLSSNSLTIAFSGAIAGAAYCN